MLRVFFEYLLPLVLPTAIYLLWLRQERKRATAAGTAAPRWQEGPWFWLALAGIALSVAVFVVTAVFWGHGPGSSYTPPELKDGQVVPGQFEDKD